ncbi:unnamed protein product [Caenorhabditis nigoni]
MPSHSTNVRPASAQNPPRIDNNEVARNPETERAIARIQPEGSFSNAWFHGDSTKENADNLLKASTAGSFMVWGANKTRVQKDSPLPLNNYALGGSPRRVRPICSRIQRRDNEDLIFQDHVFKSLSEVVRNCPTAVYQIVTSGDPNQASIPAGQGSREDNNSNGPNRGSVASQPVESGPNNVPRVRQTHQRKRTQAHKALVQQAQQTGRFSRLRKFLNNEVTAGGTSVHKLVNGGSQKMAFKIKTTNNNEYRIFGFVDPSGSKDLIMTRTAGAPKEDRSGHLLRRRPS